VLKKSILLINNIKYPIYAMISWIIDYLSYYFCGPYNGLDVSHVLGHG